ncbi:uncharacterized protein LOC126687809 [Mercurialis annua]|uniref:uncharacterized protein LOC126687809 n=1 Tax=Mercurialis annua TaxID=3986 RepID=UPI00215F2DE7|nr:uncharacterized protein LOC126687809 [Mercurialis annua]
MATRFKEEFSRLIPRRHSASAPSLDTQAAANYATWSPPVSEIKINFDGAYRKDDKMGVALALREAILLARRLRIQNLIFEGDAKSIIDFMSGKGIVGSDCEVIMINCKALCEQSNFNRFKFIYRHCNWMAHDITKKALRDPLFCNNPLIQMVWLDTRL